MAEKFGVEIPCCPTGNIIGGFSVTGKIFYGGRQQGPEIVAGTDDECVNKCRAVKEQMKSEPWAGTGEDWEIRIYT